MASRASKNPYSARLQEFSTFVFNEERIYDLYRENGGGWSEHFAARMGHVPDKIVLEIGCSNAAYLTEIAKANPRTAFVGMDWKYKVIFKGGKKVEDEKLTNVVLLRGLAQDLPRIFGRADLDEIWIFFPDPWAKKSQLKHRLVREEFLLQAHHCLRPGGRIHFKTDHPGYFQWVLSLFGVPEPELPKYDDETPEEFSRRTRQIKVRRLEEAENLPPASEKSRAAFRMDQYSVDYWREPVEPEDIYFKQRQTLFEKLFLKDKLPIYYVGLTKL